MSPTLYIVIQRKLKELKYYKEEYLKLKEENRRLKDELARRNSV